jgi:hypothetical protein
MKLNQKPYFKKNFKNPPWLGSGIFVLLFLVFIVPSCMAQPPLLIYINSDESPQKIQDEFKAMLGGSDVLAFGRVRDLQQMIDEQPQAPVIAPGVFLELNTEYKVILRGLSKGRRGEKFYVIAKDNNVKASNLSELRTGILDFLGRRNIRDFLNEAFGLDFNRIRRVNKREDLLTLLGMEAVDVIVVSESELALLKTETRLDLIPIAETKALVANFPVLASASGQVSADVLNKIKAGNKTVFEIMDIQQWGDK